MSPQGEAVTDPVVRVSRTSSFVRIDDEQVPISRDTRRALVALLNKPGHLADYERLSMLMLGARAKVDRTLIDNAMVSAREDLASNGHGDLIERQPGGWRLRASGGTAG